MTKPTSDNGSPSDFESESIGSTPVVGAKLYLIAHKAHGVATFDVAEQLACPECLKYPNPRDENNEPILLGCDECDGLGYWWIGATSGWRMYPWWWKPLEDFDAAMGIVPDMPAYARNLHNPLSRPAEPAKPSGLLAALGLVKPVEPIKRRL